MEFLSDGSTSNYRRKLLWTVITDVFAYSTAQNAFCCLVGAILNILCPQERRVFQSKLGVSSSNQCNLHHSPHTEHLEKWIKKRLQSFSDTVYKPADSASSFSLFSFSSVSQNLWSNRQTYLCNPTLPVIRIGKEAEPTGCQNKLLILMASSWVYCFTFQSFFHAALYSSFP